MNDPMQIYLAARYSRREELCEYRRQLLEAGFNVQARWLDGQHQISREGVPLGDHGEQLVESDEGGEGAAELRKTFCQDDYEDVLAADVVISFTEEPRSSASRGGRHVEFGIALAGEAIVLVVGWRENLFHWHPKVNFFPTWDHAKAALCRFRDPVKGAHETSPL